MKMNYKKYKNINYPDLYKEFFGTYPKNWLVGHVLKVRTGYSADKFIRKKSASGGILTQTLKYLLENNYVDAVILACQGVPSPEKASPVIAETIDDIFKCMGSIYIPVNMLEILDKLNPKKRYAITCLPHESAILRKMQVDKSPSAMQIKYILGPYTGTALYPSAIRCYLRSKKIRKNDKIVKLQWRAGEWPGYLEIKMSSGKIIKTPKIYYNFLIPFFITKNSLESMDFANEFADISVGDAWSPKFESLGGGHSVVVTRTHKMEEVISKMIRENLICLKDEDLLKASDMHGHMLDFKKRGGWLRNEFKRKFGINAPDYGYKPKNIPLTRIFVEIIISSVFFVGKFKFVRWTISFIPESIIGPLFNFLRLKWKKISRPTKRKGLSNFEVEIFK